MGTPSDWLLCTMETLLVGGGLVIVKLFRRGDKDEAPALTAIDVYGCLLRGLIFAVFTRVSVEYDSLEARSRGDCHRVRRRLVYCCVGETRKTFAA
jgi:hypothetical protein